tara:strand:- start:4476 stop:4886 length:411 start_codon:yes stop_codon:yes gene_type:complete
MSTKISENTSVQLDLKTVIAIITITASFVGMYYTLQADIEEAKKLPPTEVKRLEYDLKQQWQTEHIEDLEERVNMLEQVDDVVFEEMNIMSALMKDGTENDGKLEELNKQLEELKNRKPKQTIIVKEVEVKKKNRK